MTAAALCYAVNGLVARLLPRLPAEAIGAGSLLLILGGLAEVRLWPGRGATASRRAGP